MRISSRLSKEPRSCLPATRSDICPDYGGLPGDSRWLLAGMYAPPEAIRLLEETAKLLAAKLGPDHQRTLASRGLLAETYRRAGRTAAAIALNEEILKLLIAKHGPD